MDTGTIALILTPVAGFLGVFLGKLIDKRANDGKHATDLIKALQDENVRRDKVTARLERTARRLEDYANSLRRALRDAGLDVPGWPILGDDDPA